MNREDVNRLMDFFESWELVEFLKIGVEDIVSAFEDEVEDKIDELNEIMGFDPETEADDD